MDGNTPSSMENSVLSRAFRRFQCQSDFIAHLNLLREDTEAVLANLGKEQEELRGILTSALICKNQFSDLEFKVLKKKQHTRLEAEIDERINKLVEIIEGHDGLIIWETNRLRSICEYLQVAETKRQITYRNYLRFCQPEARACATLFTIVDLPIISDQSNSTESNAESENI